MSSILKIIAISIFTGLLLTSLSFFVTSADDSRILFCEQKSSENRSHGFPKAYYDEPFEGGVFPANCVPPFTGALSQPDLGARFYLNNFISNLVFWSIVSVPIVSLAFVIKNRVQRKRK